MLNISILKKQPKKIRNINIRMTSLFYTIITMEAKKRNIDMSSFIRNAVYEYIYRPMVSMAKHDTPIVRLNVDRTPKGSSTERNIFKDVVGELKTFDMNSLRKVPESELRHIYNVVVRNK